MNLARCATALGLAALLASLGGLAACAVDVESTPDPTPDGGQHKLCSPKADGGIGCTTFGDGGG